MEQRWLQEQAASPEWYAYYIPFTYTLRNKFTTPEHPYGEPNPEKLRSLEEQVTKVRMRNLYDNPIQGNFDYNHMKAVHHAIFQDVYDWAGQERTAPTNGPMVKLGHAYYPAGPNLTAAAHAQYELLARKNLLRGLDQNTFVTGLAESWGEINVVHSFREGNTRSQFVFFSQLAQQAGYHIDTAAFAPGNPLRDEFVQARFYSQDTGRNDRLAAVLGKAITPISPSVSAQGREIPLQREVGLSRGVSLNNAGDPNLRRTDDAPTLGSSEAPKNTYNRYQLRSKLDDVKNTAPSHQQNRSQNTQQRQEPQKYRQPHPRRERNDRHPRMGL